MTLQALNFNHRKVIRWAQDFLRSNINISSFYFTESFIFSSFWMFFAPFLFSQYFAVKHKNKKGLLFLLAVIILSVFFSSVFISIFSLGTFYAFYYHTFPFQQTFRYALDEHLYLLLLFYSVPVLIVQFFTKNSKWRDKVSDTQNGRMLLQFATTLVVSYGNIK